MNFIGHHEVARQYSGSDDPAYLFGSMVYDFVGMFRLPRLYRRVKSPEGRLRDGMDTHTPTNVIFDGLEVMRTMNRAMTRSFKSFGMDVWPANQAAAVGKDILFDAYFIDKPDAINSYRQTIAAAVKGKIDFGNFTEPMADFTERLNLFAKMGIPNYKNPYVVALRLQRRLDGTSCGFDKSLVGPVGDTLGEFLPDIHNMGAEVVQLVVSGLRARSEAAPKLTDEG